MSRGRGKPKPTKKKKKKQNLNLTNFQISAIINTQERETKKFKRNFTKN